MGKNGNARAEGFPLFVFLLPFLNPPLFALSPCGSNR